MIISSPEERVLVALGGNAIERDGDVFCRDAISEAVRAVLTIFPDPVQLAFSHGNGPQFGFLEEKYFREGEEKTLAELIYETQKLIGNIICTAIEESLDFRDPRIHYTKVLVDQFHESFKQPVKGVGQWQESLIPFIKRLVLPQNIIYDPEKGYRKIVPSPLPEEILKIEFIRKIVQSGQILICGGGGGVPIIHNWSKRDPRGELGVQEDVKDIVVVDKDLTASLIADGIQASIFLIITDVDGYYENWDQVDKLFRREMSVSEALQRGVGMDGGVGNMNPKIFGLADFVNRGVGRLGIVTSLENVKLFADAIRNGIRREVAVIAFLERATIIRN